MLLGPSGTQPTLSRLARHPHSPCRISPTGNILPPTIVRDARYYNTVGAPSTAAAVVMFVLRLVMSRALPGIYYTTYPTPHHKPTVRTAQASCKPHFTHPARAILLLIREVPNAYFLLVIIYIHTWCTFRIPYNIISYQVSVYILIYLGGERAPALIVRNVCT